MFEQIVDHTVARRERDMGTMTLFGGGDDGGPGDDFERTAIPTSSSTSATASPSRRRCSASTSATTRCWARRRRLSRRTDGAIDELDSFDDGAMKSIGGVITGLQRKWTRKGDLMAVFALEDLRSSVEVMVFPARCRSRATSWPTTRWSS